MKIFEDARDRCLTEPMKGVPFTLEDFHEAVNKYDYDFSVNDKVITFLFGVRLLALLLSLRVINMAYDANWLLGMSVFAELIGFRDTHVGKSCNGCCVWRV